MRPFVRAALLIVLLAGTTALAAEVEGGVAGPLPVDAFARIERGMGEQQVISLVGVPTAEGSYRPRRSGLFVIFGRGAARRTYFYRGLGRVLFDGGNELLRNGTVAKVEIDPAEPGSTGSVR